MRVEYINPFVETSYRVLKEVLGGAGLVGTVDHGDRGVRQVDLRVLLLDCVIVPLGDLAVEDLGDGLAIKVQVLVLAGDALEVEHDGDRGNVDRDVERGAGSAHALRLGDLVIAQRGIGTGPRGGTGEEGAHASARTARVVRDLRVRILRLVAGDPCFDSCLLRGGAGTLELAGNLLGGRCGLAGSAGATGHRLVVSAGAKCRKHDDT